MDTSKYKFFNIDIQPSHIEEIAKYVEQKFGKLSYIMIADPSLPISPITSRVGGLPYWPQDGANYPVDDVGQPLRFMCQVNLQEVAATPFGAKVQTFNFTNTLPKTGLLQFYAIPDESFGCTFEPDNPRCKVVYHPDCSADSALSMQDLRLRIASFGLDENAVSNLNDQDTEFDWPIRGECALRFVPSVAVPCYGDDALINRTMLQAFNDVLKLNLGIQDYTGEIDNKILQEFVYFFDDCVDEYDLYEKIRPSRDLSPDDAKGEVGWLLGYPDFTQSNPVAYEPELEQRFDTVLLCLNGSSAVGENFDMIWGDCGIADFFINSDKLAQCDFSDIFYSWDCC